MVKVYPFVYAMCLHTIIHHEIMIAPPPLLWNYFHKVKDDLLRHSIINGCPWGKKCPSKCSPPSVYKPESYTLNSIHIFVSLFCVLCQFD